jgi:hypothetical protein
LVIFGIEVDGDSRQRTLVLGKFIDEDRDLGIGAVELAAGATCELVVEVEPRLLGKLLDGHLVKVSTRLYPEILGSPGNSFLNRIVFIGPIAGLEDLFLVLGEDSQVHAARLG